MIIDKTQLARQIAIVDMIKMMPESLGWHAISVMPVEAQNDLYDFLHDIEVSRGDRRCSACRRAVGVNAYDDELCATCGDRSEQTNNMRQMMATSGVDFR